MTARPANEQPAAASTLPARGSTAWLIAHKHPLQPTCIHNCQDPTRTSWRCSLLSECGDGDDPYLLCPCHWALL
jgi:hypothetical protein